MKLETEIRKKLKQVRTDRLKTIKRLESALKKGDDLFIEDFSEELGTENTMIKTLRWVLGFEKYLTSEDMFKEFVEQTK